MSQDTNSQQTAQGHESPLGRQIVTIANIRIAASIASQCRSPELRALHLRSARSALDELTRQVAECEATVAALEIELVRADQAERQAERQAELFPAGALSR